MAIPALSKKTQFKPSRVVLVIGCSILLKSVAGMRYTKSVKTAKTAAKMLKFTRVGVPPRACCSIKAPDRPRIMIVKVSSAKRRSAVEIVFRESMVVDLW